MQTPAWLSEQLKRAPQGLAVPLLVMLGCLTLLTGIYYPFILSSHPLFDDFTQIEGQALRQSAYQMLFSAGEMYRPLFFLLLKAQAQLFGWEEVWGYGAVSVALHLINGTLVGALIGRLFTSPPLGAVAGFFWVLNPACIETVFWIAAQNEALASTFALLSLHCWLSAIRPSSGSSRVSRLILASGAGVTLFLSLLAKESALGLPVLYLALALVRDGVRSGVECKALLRRIGVCLLLASMGAVAYIFLRVSLAGVESHYGNPFELVAESNILLNTLSHLAYLVSFKYGGSDRFVSWVIMTGSVLYAVLLVLGFRQAGMWMGAALGIALLAILAPVLWVTQHPYAFMGGRLNYLAQTPLFVILGILCRREGTRFSLSWWPWAFVACILLAATVSLHSARRRFTTAQVVTRQVVEYLASHVTRSTLIRGVPYWYVDGPPLLNCAALRHYLEAKRGSAPDISCELVYLEIRRGSVYSIPTFLPDTTSNELGATYEEIVVPEALFHPNQG